MEKGFGSRPFTKAITLHTIGNATVRSNAFNRWTRWYQTDGKTQVFRLFKGEENARNNRGAAARIEAATSKKFRMGKTWQEWSARYTAVNIKSCGSGHACFIFQSKSIKEGEEWGVMLLINGNGDLIVEERGGVKKKVLSNVGGKAFDVKIRDNGNNFEAFVNNKLVHKGS